MLLLLGLLLKTEEGTTSEHVYAVGGEVVAGSDLVAVVIFHFMICSRMPSPTGSSITNNRRDCKSSNHKDCLY